MLILASLFTFVFVAIMAMAGVGAAFILVPLFLALGVEIHVAMATALLLNAVSTSVSTITFLRKRLIEWRIAVPVLIVATVLSPVGVKVSQGMDRHLLLWLFSGFLVVASSLMLFYKPRQSSSASSFRTQAVMGSAIGGLAGFIGGLLGVGGGSIIVPALVGSGLEPKRAAATASFVIIFASLSGFLARASLTGIDKPLLLATTVASAGGAALGAWLASEKLKSSQLKFIIAIVLLATAGKMIWGLL